MNQLTSMVIGYLLEHQFSSKKQMANAIGINYRTFLRTSAGKADANTSTEVMLAIIRYCVKLQIALAPAIIRG